MLDWATVINYTFLAEFDLLQFGWHDICEDQWAKPDFQDATTSFFKLQGAQDEIVRCNVEIQRLTTFIRDE